MRSTDGETGLTFPAQARAGRAVRGFGPGPVVGLDTLRGLAAVLVVLGHARFHLELLLGASLTGGINRILMLPTSFAQEAVGVFFVLSGYLVGGQVVRQVSAQRFTWRSFGARRLSRLWTVVIPGLTITAAVDAFGSLNARWSGESSGDGSSRFVRNALFVQDASSTYGSNDSLWSLSYEFWYYVGFAALATAVVARGWKVALRALVAAVALAIPAVAIGSSFFLYSASWLLGALIAVIADRVGPVRHSRIGLSLAGVAVPASMIVSNELVLQRESMMLLVGAATCPLLLLLATRRDPVPRFATRLEPLGRWSFSIYVFHLPLVKLLLVLMAPALIGSSANALRVLAYCVAVIVVLASLPLYWLFERNTDWVRAHIEALIDRPATWSRGKGRRRSTQDRRGSAVG